MKIKFKNKIYNCENFFRKLGGSIWLIAFLFVQVYLSWIALAVFFIPEIRDFQKRFEIYCRDLESREAKSNLLF